MSSKVNIMNASEDRIQAELNRKANRKKKISAVLPFMGLITVIVLFAILTGGRFVSAENLKLLLNQCYTMVIVIIGGAFLYSIGGLDMAIGTIMAFTAMVITLMMNAGISFALSFIVGILLSVGLMSITAFARNYLNIVPFIASMCVMNVCQGIMLTITAKNGVIHFPYSRIAMLDTVPFRVVFLIILLAAGYILFNLTDFGKSLKAIGGNPKVARISGIKVERMTWLAYAVMGIVLAIAAVYSLMRSGSADATSGSSLGLNVMTAIVLGGFPLTGGANAKFSAPIVGALTVTCLTNGLALLGQTSYMGYAIKGLLFLIVVGLTYEKSKGKLID